MKKGQGAQYNPHNKYISQEVVREYDEGLDDIETDPLLKVYLQQPKTVVNKVTSPDVGMMYSVNPYQGCEHGCVYCYARNTHEYWGFSAGVDFERKIVVKENTPELLEKFIQKKTWTGEHAITFSGNTDCYQPLERKYQLTRKCLEVLLKHKHATGFITKNTLFLRDFDIIQELNRHGLFRCYISLNSLNDDLRRKLEPRTATHLKKLQAIEKLRTAGIPVSVIIAPVIPGLNDHEIPEIVKAVTDVGANTTGYIMVRLNGQVGPIFENWVRTSFPDRAEKILNQVHQVHGGQLNDSRFGTRMKGEGPYATMVRSMYDAAQKKYRLDLPEVQLNKSLFLENRKTQLSLW